MRLSTGRTYKPEAYKHFGDPGFPRPMVDRGEGAQGSREDHPKKTYRDLRQETVFNTLPLPKYEGPGEVCNSESLAL
ncbi:MAG: hypothetical protein QXM48_00300 [Sulfolobales archaeon]